MGTLEISGVYKKWEKTEEPAEKGSGKFDLDKTNIENLADLITGTLFEKKRIFQNKEIAENFQKNLMDLLNPNEGVSNINDLELFLTKHLSIGSQDLFKKVDNSEQKIIKMAICLCVESATIDNLNKEYAIKSIVSGSAITKDNYKSITGKVCNAKEINLSKNMNKFLPDILSAYKEKGLIKFSEVPPTSNEKVLKALDAFKPDEQKIKNIDIKKGGLDLELKNIQGVDGLLSNMSNDDILKIKSGIVLDSSFTKNGLDNASEILKELKDKKILDENYAIKEDKIWLVTDDLGLIKNKKHQQLVVNILNQTLVLKKLAVTSLNSVINEINTSNNKLKTAQQSLTDINELDKQLKDSDKTNKDTISNVDLSKLSDSNNKEIYNSITSLITENVKNLAVKGSLDEFIKSLSKLSFEEIKNLNVEPLSSYPEIKTMIENLQTYLKFVDILQGKVEKKGIVNDAGEINVEINNDLQKYNKASSIIDPKSTFIIDGINGVLKDGDILIGEFKSISDIQEKGKELLLSYKSAVTTAISSVISKINTVVGGLDTKISSFNSNFDQTLLRINTLLIKKTASINSSISNAQTELSTKRTQIKEFITAQEKNLTGDISQCENSKIIETEKIVLTKLGKVFMSLDNNSFEAFSTKIKSNTIDELEIKSEHGKEILQLMRENINDSIRNIKDINEIEGKFQTAQNLPEVISLLKSLKIKYPKTDNGILKREEAIQDVLNYMKKWKDELVSSEGQNASSINIPKNKDIPDLVYKDLVKSLEDLQKGVNEQLEKIQSLLTYENNKATIDLRNGIKAELEKQIGSTQRSITSLEEETTKLSELERQKTKLEADLLVVDANIFSTNPDGSLDEKKTMNNMLKDTTLQTKLNNLFDLAKIYINEKREFSKLGLAQLYAIKLELKSKLEEMKNRKVAEITQNQISPEKLSELTRLTGLKTSLTSQKSEVENDIDSLRKENKTIEDTFKDGKNPTTIASIKTSSLDEMKRIGKSLQNKLDEYMTQLNTDNPVLAEKATPKVSEGAALQSQIVIPSSPAEPEKHVPESQKQQVEVKAPEVKAIGLKEKEDAKKHVEGLVKNHEYTKALKYIDENLELFDINSEGLKAKIGDMKKDYLAAEEAKKQALEKAKTAELTKTKAEVEAKKTAMNNVEILIRNKDVSAASRGLDQLARDFKGIDRDFAYKKLVAGLVGLKKEIKDAEEKKSQAIKDTKDAAKDKEIEATKSVAPVEPAPRKAEPTTTKQPAQASKSGGTASKGQPLADDIAADLKDIFK